MNERDDLIEMHMARARQSFDDNTTEIQKQIITGMVEGLRELGVLDGDKFEATWRTLGLVVQMLAQDPDAALEALMALYAYLSGMDEVKPIIAANPKSFYWATVTTIRKDQEDD